jgi:hypothetical protein
MDEDVRREFNEIRAILRVVAERQAAAEKRMDRADARMEHWEARMDRADARAQQMDERFEKRMRGFEKLVLIGMRELADLRRSQKQTQASLRAFMDSLRRGGNGSNGGRPH